MPRLQKYPGLALALIIALTGCAPSPESLEPAEPEVPPSPVVTQLPSDDLFEAARLGATRAVGAYLERSDLITSEGGVSPERMASLVTPEWYP